jgi:phosphoribosyl 1,2-cyclic phosphodiesterase
VLEPSLRVTIWGCRGSLATPGPGTVRYGGNTSCLEVRLGDGTLLVLDAGTGIHPLGLELGPDVPRTIHLLLTHLHFDHLEGLGFFAPLWVAETDLHLWGPPSPVRSLEERIARYFSPPLFPVQLSDVPAQMTFHDVPDEEWEIGSARLLAQPVSHPGPTVGYRLSEDGRSLAYIPDHEPALGVDLSTVAPEWMSGYALAEGVDFLLHDSQYSEDEYPARAGWGHSSVEQAVAFARISHARRLLMFHHDPDHGDEDLEGLLRRAGELWGDEGEPPLLAYEGLEFKLS